MFKGLKLLNYVQYVKLQRFALRHDALIIEQIMYLYFTGISFFHYQDGI